MVMIARTIWRLENAKKYTCPACNFSTHNKSLYNRHKQTIRHWLRTEIYQAPRDIKMLIALP